MEMILMIVLLLILVFILLRAFWCWYWKINSRLHEMEKTNILLTDIRALLVQGNTVNAITAGQVTDIANSGDAANMAPADESEIPDL